jgi:hypothetical protein
VCTEKDVSGLFYAPTWREGPGDGEGAHAEKWGKGRNEWRVELRMGAAKSARGYGSQNECHHIILWEEDAISHAKSEQSVGWDREESERKDENKERTGEGGVRREERDTHESAIPIYILVPAPFLPLIHSCVTGT